MPVKGVAVTQPRQRAEELHLARGERLLQSLDEAATEQARQHAHRQEKPRSTGDPSAAIRRQSAAGHDAMQVGVVREVLPPGVEHGKEADLGPQMSGIRGDGRQRLGDRAEQDGVDDLLVLKGDFGDLLRHGEDHVKILRVEKLGTPVIEPAGAGQRLAFRAMPVAAAVVGDAPMSARVALLDMAAERGRSADLDRPHGPTLWRGQRRTVLLAIGLTVAAQHVRHFRPRPSHRPDGSGGRCRSPFEGRLRQKIERACCRAHLAGGDPQVAGGRLEAAVSEQQPNGARGLR